MTPREIALRVAWSYHGTLYVWGGDDPSGLDCSGFVIECLRSAGVFPRAGDATAEALRARYAPVASPRPSDLVFWVTDGRATHVGILLENPAYYLGADGGTRETRTAGDAIRANAFVKVRPVASRGTPPDRRFADPFGD